MGFREGTPTVTVQLDKERELGFTTGAMKRARKLGVLNINMTDNLALLLALPELVWSCLDEKDRAELSVEDLDEIIIPRNAGAIGAKVTQLIKEALPEPDDTSGNAEPPAATKPTGGKKKSTSTNSGQPESMTSV